MFSLAILVGEFAQVGLEHKLMSQSPNYSPLEAKL